MNIASRFQFLQEIENKPFFISIALFFFFALFGYEIVRPASSAILNTEYGAGGLPYAWIGTTILLPILVYAYNRCISIWGFRKVFAVVLWSIIITPLIFWYLLKLYPKYTSIALYIWKDIYILIVLEQTWALCNTTYNPKQAKALYGVLAASGCLGAIGGNYFVMCLSDHLTSIDLTLFNTIIYAICLLFFYFHSNLKQRNVSKREKTAYSQDGGFQILIQFKHLLMLFIVIAMIQVIVSLVDYQLNYFIKQQIVEQERTGYFAQLYFIINILAFVIQLVLANFIITHAGIRTTHIAIPLVSLIPILISAFLPHILLLSISFISLKSLDYSLFRVVKEMLYIPYPEEVQYKAKGVIDMFAYRGAKVLSSALILFLEQTISNRSLMISLIFYLIIICFVVWVSLISQIASEYLRKAQHQE